MQPSFKPDPKKTSTDYYRKDGGGGGPPSNVRGFKKSGKANHSTPDALYPLGIYDRPAHPRGNARLVLRT